MTTYQPGEAVEVVTDDGVLHQTGLVGRRVQTVLGMRYEVHALNARHVVAAANLRPLQSGNELQVVPRVAARAREQR